MNVAVMGAGGREHAIAVKCLSSDHTENVHVIPGNTGMLKTGNLTIHPAWDGSFSSLHDYLVEHRIELVIVGNESYLAAGITDYFSTTSIRVFGPTKAGAELESSKDFAKRFMNRHGIPTASHHTCHLYKDAIDFMASQEGTLVLKQDGLALGKGVLVTDDREEASEFLRKSFTFTDTVVFEQFLEGREFSLLAFVNSDYCNLMVPARDYKRAFDHDQGPNTGGMGSYTPVEYVADEDLRQVKETIVDPTVQGLVEDGIEFTGILYFGLMKTEEGVKVIEYNVRFGDPETEVLLESMESDLLEAILATFEKKPYRLQWKRGFTLGVCLASEGYPGNYSKGHPLEIPEDITWYSMAMEQDGSRYRSNGGRVLFVVANGDSLEQARTNCHAQIDQIKSEHLFHRRDIGL